MFKAKDEITTAVEALWTAFTSRDRGETIPWGEIEPISGSRREYPGKTIIGKWCKRMRRERCIVAWAVPGVGIRLLTHKQAAVLVPQVRQRRARRQHNRALRELDTVNVTALSDHERHVLAQQMHNLKYQRLMIGRSYRELERASQGTEATPLRKRPAEAAVA
jgi:hypothetical protein